VYLIGINAIVFIIVRMLFIIFQNNQETMMEEYQRVVAQFAVPAQAGDFIQKPWTLLLYSFSHVSFSMFISNLLWLFSFSYLLQTIAGNQYIIPAYIYGALVSALVFLGIHNLLPQSLDMPQNAWLIGATPAILSVAVMAVTLAPRFRIFPFIKGGIPVWVLLAFFVFVDLLALFFQNKTLIPVHLAGAAMGYFYAWLLRRNTDPGAWMGRLYEELSGRRTAKKGPQEKAEEKRFYKSDTDPFVKTKKVTQSTVDEILDKINKSGYGSLTKEEREILEKAKDAL
jgi:membrane associated rhomboid family serine protease